MPRLSAPVVQKRLLVGKTLHSVGTTATDRDTIFMRGASDADVFYTTNGTTPVPYAPSGARAKQHTKR